MRRRSLDPVAAITRFWTEHSIPKPGLWAFPYHYTTFAAFEVRAVNHQAEKLPIRSRLDAASQPDFLH
jgi:hypothetical protein